ncbi:MAG: hypothetical protein CM15mV4_2000 [Caudoviricetes sp.]|nr:MAG: hypothetical protein CM15mV4_2000 [Caudoviricetes sp.]
MLEIAKDVFNFSKQQQEEQATMEVPAEEDAEEFQPKNNTGGQSKMHLHLHLIKQESLSLVTKINQLYQVVHHLEVVVHHLLLINQSHQEQKLEDVRDDMYDEDGNLTEPENSLEESKTQRSLIMQQKNYLQEVKEEIQSMLRFLRKLM